MKDIRSQVAAGAEHITFGDPDFLNGPAHATRVVQALHREHPRVTYDVTIKIEHLLRHRELLPILANTRCLLITSAAESVDDAVLRKLDKGHTRADFLETVRLVRDHNIALAPTFIPFTPWTTHESYRELLQTLADLDLIDAISPVQLALRLLITAGSRLLDLPDIRSVAGEFDTASLVYPWRHEDPELDALGSVVMRIVREDVRTRKSRQETFRRVWQAVHSLPMPESEVRLSRTVIPYLEEPWFC
jgi:hypothetical protein